jgi:hypothetical protein
MVSPGGPQLGDYFHDGHGVPDQHRIGQQAQTFKRNEPQFGPFTTVPSGNCSKLNETNPAR